VERDDARAVHFSTGSANELTLSIPATARTVIAVGACRPKSPLELSTSSSRGPTRDERHKPELVAPGVCIVAAKAGTTTGLVAMTGTSMAAPHVAGAIALLLASRARRKQPQLNAAQIKAALSQCIKNFNGRFQPGFGHGALDVAELLNAFS
jgi:subtilisin family serine protease